MSDTKVIGFERTMAELTPTRNLTVRRAEDFRPVSPEYDVKGVGDVLVGEDHRLYRKTTGLLRMWAPVLPVEGSPESLWVEKIDWDSFPPMAQLRHLYHTFLSRYNREVMFLIGQRRDGNGWVYVVPPQIGNNGSVEWDWNNERWPQQLDGFDSVARFIGTVHVQPSTMNRPSFTDIKDWQKTVNSGLHVVFAKKDGSWSITGSSYGYTAFLCEGGLEACGEPEVCELETYGVPLDDLLVELPSEENYGVIVVVDGGRSGKYRRRGKCRHKHKHNHNRGRGNNQDRNRTVKRVMRWIGAYRMEVSELQNLRLVDVGQDRYLLTDTQLRRLKWLFDDEGIEVPSCTPVRIVSGEDEGGRRHNVK